MGLGLSRSNSINSNSTPKLIKSKSTFTTSIKRIRSRKSSILPFTSSFDSDDNNNKGKKLESFRFVDLQTTFRRLTRRDGKCTPILEQRSSYIRADHHIVSSTNSQEFFDRLSSLQNSEKGSERFQITTDCNLSIANQNDETMRRFSIQPCDYSSMTEFKAQRSSQFHDVQMCTPDDSMDDFIIGSYDYKHVCTLCQLEFDTKLMFDDHINLSKIHMVKLLEFKKRRETSRRRHSY